MDWGYVVCLPPNEVDEVHNVYDQAFEFFRKILSENLYDSSFRLPFSLRVQLAVSEGYRLLLLKLRPQNNAPYVQGEVFSKRVPCNMSGVALQKSHDFITDDSLSISKDLSAQYLLLYRNPLSSISSEYLLYEERCARNGLEPVAWSEYAVERIEVWNRFMKKWHIEDVPNAFRLNYDDFVDNPFDSVSRVIGWMLPGHELCISSFVLSRTCAKKL